MSVQMKNSVLYCFLFLCSISTSIAQKNLGSLPKELSEISGLTLLNDSIFVGHNDSGNEAVLYFLNLNGEQIHSVIVENAKNKDWEDITSDNKGFIYIADTGNNKNDRESLCVYKVNSKGILKKKSVVAEKIVFSYSEQLEFPPSKSEFNFDSEALAFYNDKLYLFTRDRAEPAEGKTFCYHVPTKPGTYVLKRDFHLKLPEQISGVEIRDNICYLLTYKSIYVYVVLADRFQYLKKIKLENVAKYEAIAVNSQGKIYIADETGKNKKGGFLYKVKF